MAWWTNFKAFLVESRAELRKVSWPTRDDVVDSTGVVLATVVAVVVCFLVYDTIFSRLMKLIFRAE